MTSKSFDSIASERRVRSHLVRDEDVYTYALRVSYLAYLMQPKPVDTTPSPQNANGESREPKEYGSRISGAIFSIGDMFKDAARDGPRPVKFPEKLIKVLDVKLQNIAMGKDPAYTDQLIRRTIAMFWGTLREESFRRQMKENRKIEELILMFVTTSTSALRKDPSLAGDGWKLELNNQIAQFILILRDALRNVHHVSPELTARLDMYTAKLVPAASSTDSGYDSSSTTREQTAPKVPSLSQNIADMPLVKIVGQLFKRSDSDLQKDVNGLKRHCTEKAALIDLKTCLKNINAGQPFPGRREDFDTDAAFHGWKVAEQAHLSQLMLIMVQFNPELAKSTPADALPPVTARPESLYTVGSSRQADPPSPPGMSRAASIGSRYSLALGDTYTVSNNPEAVGDAIYSDEEVPLGHTFTYIPPAPKKFYKRLLELCLEDDLEVMKTLPEDQEVSLGILSSKHLEVINECALRWRIMPSYRVASFLEVMKYKYERDEVPMECIPEALQVTAKSLQDHKPEMWPHGDLEYLSTIYSGIFSLFLSSLYHTLDALPALKPDQVMPFVEIIEQVQASGLLERFQVDALARLRDLSDRVRVIAVHHYTEKSNEIFADPGVNRALPLLLLTDVLEKQAKLLNKRFPEPILGQLDFASLFLETQIPLFLTDLDNARKRLLEGSLNQPTPDIPIEDLFALFRRTKTLLNIYKAFCPEAHTDFDTAGFFEPYVRQWLVSTDNKTGQWVQGAVTADKFEPEGAEGHSSSIVDLFDSLRSPITFLLDLEWPDEYQEARFFTSLARTVSKSLEEYCRIVEDMFMTEMYPRPTEPPLQPQKQSAWIESAKRTIQGEKKIEGFNFTPQSCVKLNNIEAARNLLDRMYNQMNADKVAAILEKHGPAPPPKNEKPRFLFTVKIVTAEGLVPAGSSAPSKLDTFVTLSDEHGMRVAKTRTIYESSEPRWDETVDISVDSPLWLMASVRDRSLIGKHDTIGRAYLCLDPPRFADFLAHEMWMDLESQGRLLLRVSMEGEKDDVQFYFGRAFRSLKRAETDMVRVFIDKMSPFIRQSLSRNVIKQLIKSTGAPTIDYTKAIANVTGLYQSVVGPSASEVQIPLPQQEKPKVRPEQLTDVDIEQPITALFDYLEANLMVLNSSLSEVAREMVMSRVWKEILNVIEGLLVPPLSDAPSNMKPLTDKEVDIVFKWLRFLLNYFFADGDGPMPLEMLQNQRYREIMSIRLYYDWHTDMLCEEAVRMLQTQLRSSVGTLRKAKSVYQQKNLGTIKHRKKEKKEKESSSGEMILRILRMRPNTQEFIAQQLTIMTQIQKEQEQRAAASAGRRAGRAAGRDKGTPAIPPVPALPS